MNKIWEELEVYKKKLAHAEATYAESKTTGKPEGLSPTDRIGFLGLIGKKVDSIEYYNEKIIELTPKLEMEQKDTLRDEQQDSALVFFTSGWLQFLQLSVYMLKMLTNGQLQMLPNLAN